MECRYFGPIQQQTQTGLFVMYRLDTFDEKTGTASWKRIVHRYRIVNEDDPQKNTVMTNVLPAGQRPILESHAIDQEGKRSHEVTSIPALHYEIKGDDEIYVDVKDLPCSENNDRWKTDGLASRVPEGLALRAKTIADVEAMRTALAKKQVGLTQGHAKAPAATSQPISNTGRDWSIVSIASRVTETNDVWWKYSWKLTLRNDANQPHLFAGMIKFLDGDGFIIESDYARDMVVRPGEEGVFTGFALIKTQVAGRVARTTAEIAMRK